ncbi:MAG TPA: 16S rRNA (cytosine(967)-C(5))-methyltransferase RsmB [Burkholderiales bacterium]
MKASAALAPALRDASRLVARVAAGRSLSEELAAVPASGASRAALLDIAHGTLRRYGRVQAIVAALSKRRAPDPALEALLWCALYALESERYAEYTVVDQAVRACGLLERWSAKGYVNALLRNFARERRSLERRLEADPQARYQHPLWWIEIVRAAWPEAWQAALAAANVAPPMCLRVNRRRASADAYAARLAEAGIAGRRIGADGVLLEEPLPVQRLPGFAEGEVSVQDAGAQRAADCLELRDGQRVLDACAAPGGKAAHLLERSDIELTALDVDAARLARVAANLERLGLRARLEAVDAVQFAERHAERRFERVLLDAPCSGSGVARRHPDIKWLRRRSDLAGFAQRQGRLLDALWRLVAPGGKLLYVTCSIFPQENGDVIDAFVSRSPDARRAPLADGKPAQWLPDAEHDGFYYALIEKQA